MKFNKKYTKREFSQVTYTTENGIKQEAKSQYIEETEEYIAEKKMDKVKTAEFLGTLLATFTAKFSATFSIELVVALIDKLTK